MTMNRRQFLKYGAAVLGTAAISDHLFSLHAPHASHALGAEAAGPSPEYEIYALKFAGPLPRKVATFLWNEGWDQEMEINYYVWAIKAKSGVVILVDTGSGPTEAPKRKLKNYVNPVQVLARIGIDGTNVAKVIITHMHHDHIGGMEVFPQAFPQATFYLQKREFDFWVKDPIVKRSLFARMMDPVATKGTAELEGTDRLMLLCGDQKIIPGIEVLFCPGHTIGLQSVAVHTAKGTAIIASDCVHIHRGFREDTTSIFITDLPAWLKSYDRLRERAASIDLVFPGHDMSMATDYPQVAEGVTRLA